MSSILDLCIRNLYAILFYTYMMNTQFIVLGLILIILGSCIIAFARHPCILWISYYKPRWTLQRGPKMCHGKLESPPNN